MADINRSINIYLNEAEVEASMAKLGTTAEKLKTKMEGAAGDPAKLKELQQQYDATTGKINTLSKQLSGELAPSMRQMEAAIGKARNELKNMATGTDEFNAKAKKLAEAETQLKKVKDEAFGVGKAINETGKSGSVFTTLKDKAQDFARGLPGIGQALGAMMGPFGLLIGAVVGLVAIIKQNAEVADKLSFIMGGLKNVVRGLADGIVELVKGGFEKLKAAIDNPKQAFKDFGDMIQENIINRFKALGVIITAIKERDFKKLTDGFIQLGTGVTDASSKIQKFGEGIADNFNKGYKAAELLDNLVEQQAQLRNSMERTNITISEQTTIMKDATRSDEERLAAAKKVVELETLNSGRKIKAVQLEIDALDLQTKGRVRSSEENAKLMDLETAKLQAITAKNDAIRKASNQAAALEAELTAKKLKEAMVVEAIPAITDAVIKSHGLIGDFIKKTTGAAMGALETFGSYAEMQYKKMQEGINAFMDQWGSSVQAGVNVVQQAFGIASEAMAIQSDKELAREKKNADEKKKHFKALLDSKKINQAQYNKAIEGIDDELDAKQREKKKKQFIADKAMKIVMAVINTALAVVNALATMPYPASIVFAALAGAVGAAQIGIIAAQPVPQFARGGVARGARHSSGGISMIDASGQKVGEMEGDEPYMILSRETYRNNGRLIDALLDTSMNKGGARLDLSAIPQQPRFNFGGVFENIRHAKFAQGGVFSNSAQNDMQTAVMSQLLDRLNQPIRADVVYQDITEKGTALNRASSRASFSRT